MSWLELKVPPALLMATFAALMGSIDWLMPAFKQHWPWRDLASSVVFAVAVLSIVSGIISFRVAGTTVDPTQPGKATSVVTSGVYRITRNPMYLGFVLVLLSVAIKLTNPISLLLLPLFMVYMNRFQIKPEERALTELFGEAYLQYLEKVRRWL